MKNSLYILVFMGMMSVLYAQDVVMSTPERLTNKTAQFKILGKNKEGIIIMKYGKGSKTIEAYNSNLKQRWKRSLNIKQPAAVIKKVVMFPEKTLLFYTSSHKSELFLFAELTNSKLQGNNNYLLVDTVSSGRYDVSEMLRIANSMDQSHIISYFPVLTDNQITGMRVTILSDELRILQRVLLPIRREENQSARKVFTDNRGNVYMLLEESVRSRRKNEQSEFKVLRYDKEDRTIETVPFVFQHPVFKKLSVDFDNINNNVIATGFYTNENGQEAKGFFQIAYNLDSAATVHQAYQPFNKELIFDVTGKDSSDKLSGFYSFEVRDVILRFDGGTTIVAESKFDTEESQPVQSFTPSIGPSFRTINISYFNDIMVLSISPEGKYEWGTVLKKKQISEDDDGFYSSYCLTVTDDKLHFLYNEEIYNKTNVNDYEVNQKGGFSREFLFNSGESNVMLVPRMAKQVSGSEIVIPSYRRNNLSLIKVSY